VAECLYGFYNFIIADLVDIDITVIIIFFSNFISFILIFSVVLDAGSRSWTVVELFLVRERRRSIYVAFEVYPK